MKIESKYNVGDKVWVVYENRGEVSVFDDVISEVCVNSEGLFYMLETACDESKEEDIVLYDEKEKLIAKIEETMNKIHKMEEENERNKI